MDVIIVGLAPNLRVPKDKLPLISLPGYIGPSTSIVNQNIHPIISSPGYKPPSSFVRVVSFNFAPNIDVLKLN